MWRDREREDIRIVHSLIVLLLFNINLQIIKEQLDISNHAT